MKIVETKEERLKRIIARGEVSGHSHIITGECEIVIDKENTIIKAGSNCAIKHLLEQPFIEEDKEVWTEEHKDIELKKGNTYQVIQQIEFNPYLKEINNVRD